MTVHDELECAVIWKKRRELLRHYWMLSSVFKKYEEFLSTLARSILPLFLGRSFTYIVKIYWEDDFEWCARTHKKLVIKTNENHKQSQCVGYS
jgi:prenyltransferase beta subunit